MNLSDIQAECGRLLGDSNNTRWVPAVLAARANLAQTEIQGYTNAVKTTVNVNLVAGASAYVLSTAILNILRVQIADSSGNIKPLTGITREQLDFLYPDWMQYQNGSPLWFYWKGTGAEIDLVPAPDYSATNALSIDISSKPADMVNSTDLPFDSYVPMVPYHIAIAHWVVAQCFMDDGTPEALTKSKFHKSGSMTRPGEYEKQLGRIMADFDVPEDVPNQILYKPQGGRVGSCNFPSKSNPLL